MASSSQPTAPAGLDLIDQPYSVTPEQLKQFREDGFIKLKDVFDQAVLNHYGDVITRLTLDHNPNKDTPLEKRSTYGKAFIQVGHLWHKDADAKAFTFSQRIARIAAELLGTRGVRLYHDQSLYKEPGGGFTPWHVDQQYWPMASARSVTAWIPLQPVPTEMGPLCFGKGSHLKNIGRDLAISDESEQRIRDAIRQEGLIEVYEPYDLGEVSFHYGWTLHRAGPNTTEQPRKVHTVIYMDQDMLLAEPKNDNQRGNWQALTSDVKVGEVMAGKNHPVIWSLDDA
ncbi:phytanoyl-CoA dioxygenase family protein [Phycisphaerales bacterium AB-hyl4]|uniref:Phytanoyl-CoA dioxygenase family protein n=1 Tax=Natronomicrosphaera hydrolytica TaxID=3242702 RepID=A0ABV4U2K0_9BACT